MVWMDEYRVMVNTILSVFDDIRVYGRLDEPVLHAFCLASPSTFGGYQEERKRRFMSAFTADEQRNIMNAAMPFIGSQHQMRSALRHHPINRDWKPVNEYYLGRSLKAKLFPKK